MEINRTRKEIKAYIENIVKWYNSNGRTFDWRETQDPYSIFVAEILLQRTQAKQAEPIFNKIITEFPDVKSLSKAKASKLRRYLKPIGLIKRGDYLVETSNMILKKYDGQFPENKQELLNLKGVGYYTACAVLVFAFEQKYAIIDSNIIRIFERLFNFDNESHEPKKRVIQIGEELLPDESKIKEYSFGLLDISAEICKNNETKCEICPITEFCSSSQ